MRFVAKKPPKAETCQLKTLRKASLKIEKSQNSKTFLQFRTVSIPMQRTKSMVFQSIVSLFEKEN